MSHQILVPTIRAEAPEASGQGDLASVVRGHVLVVLTEAGVSRSLGWVTEMVVARMGDAWDLLSETYQIRVRKIVSQVVKHLPSSRFRVLENVRGLDESSGHDEDNHRRRKGATVVVDLEQFPDVGTHQDARRVLRPEILLADKTTRGAWGERAVRQVLRSDFRLCGDDPEYERRVFRGTKLGDWDYLIWDNQGRVICAIEVKNLATAMATRLSLFPGLEDRIREATSLGTPSVVVVPRCTKRFRRQVEELGGVVIETGCVVVGSVAHARKLRSPWVVQIGALTDVAAGQLLEMVKRLVVGVSGYAGPWSDQRVLTDEERGWLRDESRVGYTSEEWREIRRYLALAYSGRRLERFDALGAGVRAGAEELGVKPNVLYRDAERWDRPLVS